MWVSKIQVRSQRDTDTRKKTQNTVTERQREFFVLKNVLCVNLFIVIGGVLVHHVPLFLHLVHQEQDWLIAGEGLRCQLCHVLAY